MAGEADNITCPFCGRELPDSHDPTIHCKFCGKKFRRMDVFNEDEKSMRQNMIIDLATHMSKLKITKNVAGFLAFCSLVAAVVMLFSEQALLPIWIVLAVFIVSFVVWIAIWGVHSNKYAKSQSKLFDLTGGRRLE